MGLILSRIRFIIPLPLLFALIEIILSSAEASQFDSRSYRFWMEKKALVRKAAESGICSDGRTPIVTEFRMLGDIMAYNLHCDDVGSRNSTNESIVGLDKRQTSLCTSSCQRACYPLAKGDINPQDCAKISSDMQTQGASNVQIPAKHYRVWTYNTCVYQIQNLGEDTLSICYSAWANIADEIMGTCGQTQGTGGRCSHPSFYVQVYSQSIETPSSFTDVVIQDFPPNPTSVSASPFSSSPPEQRNNSTGITSTTTSSSSSTAMIVGVAIGLIAIFALVTIVLLAWRRSRRDGTGYIAAIITQFSSGAPIEPARPWLQLPDTTPIDEQNASPLVGSPQGTQNAPRKNTMASTPVSPMISSNSNGERSRPRKATLPSTGLPQQVRPTPRRNTLAGAPVPVVAIPTPNETTEPSSQEQYQPEQVQEQEQEQYGPESTAQFHPRSTEALIAAAAPRNMSREQINELAANLVSLIRGRDPRNEGTDYGDDESLQEPPPYQGSL